MKGVCLFVVASFLFCSAVVAETRKDQLESLFKTYDKTELIEFILAKSKMNRMTVQVNNKLYVKTGRPAQEYVTLSSINNDIRRLKLTIKNVRDGLDAARVQKKLTTERKKKENEYWKAHPVVQELPPKPKEKTTPKKNPKETPWYIKDGYDRNDRVNAQMYVEQVIKRILKAPSTAKFQYHTKWTPKRVHGQTYKFASYVDAQNGFGALIRTRFSGKVEQVGKDRWRVLSLRPWMK